jgi:hypothetical protein
VDLAALEFTDSGGVAALARGRKQARHAGGDLLLAAPRQQVTRVLAITRLIDGRNLADRRFATRRGADPGRVDIVAPVIRMFERLGWAAKVRRSATAHVDSRHPQGAR